MNKKLASLRTVKLVIDIILGLLYILLLGYAFTGGRFHEVAGIVFMSVALIHNIVNIRWYKALRNGTYIRKRWLVVTINIALVVDMAAILLTGLLSSRYLLHTGLHLTGIGTIHTVLALIGLSLVIFHVMVHGFSHAKKKYRKLPILAAASVCLLTVLLGVFLLPYLKRHFLTVAFDRQTAVSGESVDFGDRRILTVYFTRVGNTDFDEKADAVAGASLMINEDADLMGNSQVIGQMIQNAVGGDILSINTKKKYPSSYSDTVSAASDEMKLQELPELIDMPENIDGYDTVFLVYPLWWHTIPKPVEAFLNSYDFSGKTVIPVVTHGGGGAGRSLEDIKTSCNGTVVDTILQIYCGDIPYCREIVTEWLKEINASGQ